MNFEKRMKKHGTENLNSIVPNPYPVVEPQRSFPFWAKFAAPIGSLLLAASIVGAIVIPVALNRGIDEPPVELSSLTSEASSSQPYQGDPNVTPSVTVVGAPKTNYTAILDKKIVSRTGPKALEHLSSYLTDPKNKNFTISPASYILCASALAAVSDGFDLNAYGLVDAKDDTKALLENWNGHYTTGKVGEEVEMCSFKSGVLHQQVGGTYAFDDEKRKEFEDAYIATSVAVPGQHAEQAQQYFEDAVDLTIPVPNVDIMGRDGVLTYGALTMMDLTWGTYETKRNPFTLDDGRVLSVQTGIYATEAKAVGIKYYEGATYLAFSFRVYTTDLMIVLPNEGVSLESVPLLEAYNEIALNNRVAQAKAYGYIPYFHLSNYSFDVGEAFIRNSNGNEKLFSKLLKRDFLRIGPAFRAYQSADFELCDKGIFGQSVTVAGSGSGAIDTRIPNEINVDRPFYAVCLKDGFPLFVNKVNNPSIGSAA